jgi:hypothetical protein
LVAVVVLVLLVGGALVGWSMTRDDDVEGSPAAGSTPTSGSTQSPDASQTPEAPETPETPGPTNPDGESVRPSPGTSVTPGSGETVPVEPVRTRAPVPLDATGDFGTGLRVRLTSIKAVDGEARGPGEIAGPALRVAVAARNAGDAAIPLEHVVVFMSYGADWTPASDLSTGSRPLGGTLAAGGQGTGVYVFSVPPDQRDDIRVEISYTGEAPTVAFQGPVRA